MTRRGLRNCIRKIETRSFPQLARLYGSRLTLYVVASISSIRSVALSRTKNRIPEIRSTRNYNYNGGRFLSWIPSFQICLGLASRVPPFLIRF